MHPREWTRVSCTCVVVRTTDINIVTLNKSETVAWSAEQAQSAGTGTHAHTHTHFRTRHSTNNRMPNTPKRTYRIAGLPHSRLAA